MPEESAPFPPLDVAHVQAALAASRFANVRYVQRTGSTNDDAAALLGHAGSAGLTIVADEQSAGRGRHVDRVWVAPFGTGLLFTTVLPHALPASELWAIPFWVALGVADGIAHACGVHVELRWPNDAFVHDRKVAGILCVSRVIGAQAYVACGVGINVLRPTAAQLAAIEPPPAFLSDAAPHVRRELVLAEVLLAYERRLPALGAPAVVARTYEERADLAGAPYRVRLDADGSVLDGIARGLGPDGTLRLVTEGTEVLINLADARRL